MKFGNFKNKTMEKYGMRGRPFGLGCQPGGHLKVEEADKRSTGYYNYVYYPERLSPQDTLRFELSHLPEFTPTHRRESDGVELELDDSGEFCYYKAPGGVEEYSPVFFDHEDPEKRPYFLLCPGDEPEVPTYLSEFAPL